MRYLDFEDYDNDMLSMEDWDNICDEAMDEAMRMMAYSDYDDDTPNPVSMRWGEDDDDDEEDDDEL